MKKRPFREAVHHVIVSATRYVELLMSYIIMIVILVMIFRLVCNLPEIVAEFHLEHDAFNEFLSSALTLVVGVEFIKMLCKHTPDTVIEVLLFAIARQMVVEHLGPVDTLIGTCSIAILFAIRRFLFQHASDEYNPDLPLGSDEEDHL